MSENLWQLKDMGLWTTLLCAKEPRKNYDLIDLKNTLKEVADSITS